MFLSVNEIFYFCYLLIHLQIQNLLDAMGLSQYKESFLREQITGDVLLDLDDAILQEELGVTSKIHRIRLTKLIQG